MTGDGSDTTLALTNAPVNENATFVTIDGVTQHKSTYSVSGTTLTFSTAPPTGSAVEAITLNTTTINTASILQDADGDTKVQVEESSDEDKIRFDTAGTERAVIDSSGLDVTGNVDASGVAQIGGSTDLLYLSGKTGTHAYVSLGGSNTAADFLIGADTAIPLIFRTSATERMRITSDGSLLVGTSTAHLTSSTFSGYTQFAGGHSIQKRSGGIVAYYDRLTDEGTIMQFRHDGAAIGGIAVASGNNLTIDGLVASHAGLEFGTGRITPRVAGATADNAVDLGYSTQRFKDLFLSGQTFGGDGAANAPTYAFGNDTNMGMYRAGNNILGFSASSAEVMRLSSGSLLVGVTSSTGAGHSFKHNSGMETYRNSSSAGNTAFRVYSNVTSTATVHCSIYNDGDIENTNGSYGTLSDIRIKSNIQPAKSQWDDVKAAKLYNYDKENCENRQLGWIAQELEEAEMGGVVKTVESERFEDGIRSVKESVLLKKAFGALQEAMERIETLEAKVQQLENN
jgi:hypothetical protein